MDNEASEKPSLFRKTRNNLAAICLFLISIGQWSDTKQVSIEIYESFIKNFTDEVELENLRQVKVGGNLNAIEKTFGIATLIKPSKTEPKLEYRFYPSNKFILTIAAIDGHIKAYQVISLDNSFNPSLPFSSDSIGTMSFAQHADIYDEYRTDDANLIYFLESHSLGRDGLFFNQFLTYVGFAADYQDSESSKQKVAELNHALLVSNDQKVSESISILRSKLTPNTFSVGDIDATTAADMIITRYEYFAYFKEKQ